MTDEQIAYARATLADLLPDNGRKAPRDQLTRAKLSVEIGRDKNYIADFISGRKLSLGAGEVVAIERALGLPAGGLLEPREIRRVPIEDDEADYARPDDESMNRGVSTVGPYRGALPGAIPDLEVSGGAGPGENSLIYNTVGGDGLTYSADAVRGEIVLPDYLLSEYTRSLPGRVHAVRVRGDSMEMTLLSGDRVFADTNDRSIGQGGVFIIVDHRYGDEVLVKRLRRAGRGTSTRIVLVSDNPKQGDDEREPGEITIVGRAIARLTRL